MLLVMVVMIMVMVVVEVVMTVVMTVQTVLMRRASWCRGDSGDEDSDC